MRNTTAITLVWCSLLLVCRSALADYEVPNPSYVPPPTYYNSATGTGTTLRTQLNTIIRTGFTGISYGDARYIFDTLDQDPNNSNNILLAYNRASVSGIWDAGVTYNREHSWPKYWLGLSPSQNGGSTIVDNGYTGVGSDLFELRPCNPSINSQRSDYGYGTVNSSGPYGQTGGYWYAGDADAGEIARGMFYMATRWWNNATDAYGRTYNLNLQDGQPTLYNMGDLASLLKWHYKHGVDNFERRRNDIIYDSYQHNRNPFVDHPEFVWTIFGGGNNNSRLYVGATSPADGTSSLDVSLGRVMKNGTLGTSTVTLNKNGANPTTFDITASGEASLGSGTGYLPLGVGQCMDYSAQTKSLLVGLSSSTASTGLKTGTIVIDNTDLTSGGAGSGSADGNDTINVSASVLDKRAVRPNDSSFDFGRVIVGGNVSQVVNLTTSGDDNSRTRVNVAASAAADSNGIGVTGAGTLFNAATATGTRTVTGTFNAPGSKAGTFSLGVTTAENGGAGLPAEGTYGPIGLSYTATVLGHAVPSFDAAVQMTTLTIDFGIVEAGTGLYSLPFNIRNLGAGPSTTAGLDLDSIAGSGSTGVITTDLSPFNNLTAGTNNAYSCSFDTAIAGTFSATYHLGLSDENLPGSTAPGSQGMTLIARGRSLTRQWIHDGDGNWSNAANWVGPVPDGAGAAAKFKNEITYGVNVMLDGNRTIGSITFDSPDSYRIAGTSSLTFQNAGGSQIEVLQGVHSISVPLALNDDLQVDTLTAASSITLTGILSSSSAHTVSKAGSGTLVIDGLADLAPGSHLVVRGGVLELGTAPVSGGMNDMQIDNASSLVVFAGEHGVTSIIGPGTTHICDGADLSAVSMIQDSLIIGGSHAALAGVESPHSVPDPSVVAMFVGALCVVLLNAARTTNDRERRSLSSSAA